ncbi:hypothetical protein HGRIS_008270 [Hohenbuehelia grisea]|uniref:F-box domain-containing protein n=1 Tax=Hohenbuehelia grisea TaxID=104357 RepID=A0ABR3J7G8_9AGAR
MTTTMSLRFLDMPPEIMLHIFSFLDLPDLEIVVQLAPLLRKLADDPALHKNRIRVIAPSRISHSLFGQAKGVALRPTVADLVHRGVMRGLGIERRWRMGIYLYSHVSVRQYETGMLLRKQHAGSVVSTYLRQRTANADNLKALYLSHVMPDVESSSHTVSRSLLPVMRKLKWSLKRDKLAKSMREGPCMVAVVGGAADGSGFTRWLESHGRNVMLEDSNGRVRLAVCPNVRKIIGAFETMGR